MANLENEEEVIETPQEEIENNEEETTYSDEDLKLFKRFNIDPNNATIEDLKNLAMRTLKAETIKIEEKKVAKKPETNNDLELRLFFIENPEFKADKEGIMQVLSDPNYKTLTPEEALAIYKLKKPKESETIIKKDIGGSYKPKPKSLGELDEKEAINLNPADYIKYLKAKGELK